MKMLFVSFLSMAALGALLGFLIGFGYSQWLSQKSDMEYNVTTIREDVSSLLVKFDQLISRD